MMAGKGVYINLEDNDVADIGQPITLESAPASTVRYDHILNLDQFFINIYYYHQHGGFKVILFEHLLNLLKFVFMVLFTIQVTQCIKWDVLTSTKEIKLWSDVIYPVGQCWLSLHPFAIIGLVCSGIFFMIQLVRAFNKMKAFVEIGNFYRTALRINDADLPDMTWHEVQSRLIKIQDEIQISVHKERLDELDIYNRILRHKNYMIAMLNKSILPVRFRLPIFGGFIYLSAQYLYNLELILFKAPGAPFETYYQLRTEFKSMENRMQLAKELSNRIIIFGVVNFILAPFILLFQVLFFIYKHAERLKSQPGHFLGRRWSNYGRLYLRHFNELDHEFSGRSSQAYDTSSKYLNSFIDRLMLALVKNVAFVAGSVCIVLFALSIIRETLMHLPGYLGLIVFAGMVARNCWNFIPDENVVWVPETLLLKALAHIHYMPDHWKGNAHTKQVRNEFSELFQYRLVALIEELLSPIITPILLVCLVRKHSLEIVDFLRNYTVHVQSIGDICSFAQMEVRKHGHPMWMPPDQPLESSQHGRTENGKLELSLMHFHLNNPTWRPTENNRAYLHGIRQQAVNDLAQGGPTSLGLHTLTTSSQLTPVNLSASHILHNSLLPSLYSSLIAGPGGMSAPFRTNVSKISGPAYPTAENYGILNAMQDSISEQTGYCGGQMPSTPPPGASLMGSSTMYQPYSSLFEEGSRELTSYDMSASALYIHELHHRRRRLQDMHRSQHVSDQRGYGRPLEPIEQEPDAGNIDDDPNITLIPKC